MPHHHVLPEPAVLPADRHGGQPSADQGQAHVREHDLARERVPLRADHLPLLTLFYYPNYYQLKGWACDWRTSERWTLQRGDVETVVGGFSFT